MIETCELPFDAKLLPAVAARLGRPPAQVRRAFEEREQIERLCEAAKRAAQSMAAAAEWEGAALPAARALLDALDRAQTAAKVAGNRDGQTQLAAVEQVLMAVVGRVRGRSLTIEQSRAYLEQVVLGEDLPAAPSGLAPKPTRPGALTKTQRALLVALRPGPAPIGDLAARLGRQDGRGLKGALSGLEQRGLVAEHGWDWSLTQAGAQAAEG